MTNDLKHVVMRCEKYGEVRNKFAFSAQFDNFTDLLKEMDSQKYRSIALVDNGSIKLNHKLERQQQQQLGSCFSNTKTSKGMWKVIAKGRKNSK